MLPTEASTKAAIESLKEAGVFAGNFYWYANNWHYITKWDHLKNATTLNRLNADQTTALLSLQIQSFAKSDAIMSRTISTAISLLWTEEQIIEKGEKMLAAITKVL
jgi:8-amino-3,8-dideoxy-alpha-D-manno-octulosonate transaminase